MNRIWKDNYRLAVQYYEKNGNIDVPITSKLYSFIYYQKYSRRKNPDGYSREKIELLDQLGIEWNNSFNDRWMNKYCMLKDYIGKNGNTNILPDSKIYDWYHEQLYMGRGGRGGLQKYRRILLEDLGIDFGYERNKKFEEGLLSAQKYYEKHGSLNAKCNYIDENGFELGKWLVYKRKAYRCRDIEIEHKPTITENEIRTLESLGMKWDIAWLGNKVSDPEYIIYYYVKEIFPDVIKLEYGDFLGVEIDIYIPSIKLGIEYDGFAWHKKEEKKKSDEKKGKICKKNGVRLLRIREKGLTNIVNCEKNYYVDPKNTQEFESVIESLIFDISGEEITCDVINNYNQIIEERYNYKNRRFDHVYEFLLKKYTEEGSVLIGTDTYTEDGINLYNWISIQRMNYKKGLLTRDQISKIDGLGISLTPVEDIWTKWCVELKKYYEEYGDVNVKIDYCTCTGLKLGKFISHCRENYRKGNLSKERIAFLEQYGIKWNLLKRHVGKEVILNLPNLVSLK